MLLLYKVNGLKLFENKFIFFNKIVEEELGLLEVYLLISWIDVIFDE